MNRDSKPILLICGWALAVLVLLKLAPPVAQNPSYHVFADRRTLLGIPNFWNVISNLPFAVVGVVGLWKTRALPTWVLFSGVLLTCFGSAWYHQAPDDARLLFDRLPMTLGFMAIVAIAFGVALGPGWSERLVIPLAAGGAATVFWWRATGNLTPYILVQFGAMLVLLWAVVSDRNLRGLWPALGWYLLAKLAESFDRPIYTVVPLSGHTLKHLLASLAAYSILQWWRARKNPKTT